MGVSAYGAMGDPSQFRGAVLREAKKSPAMTAGPVSSELLRDQEIDYGEPIRFEQARPVAAGLFKWAICVPDGYPW